MVHNKCTVGKHKGRTNKSEVLKIERKGRMELDIQKQGYDQNEDIKE